MIPIISFSSCFFPIISFRFPLLSPVSPLLCFLSSFISSSSPFSPFAPLSPPPSFFLHLPSFSFTLCPLSFFLPSSPLSPLSPFTLSCPLSSSSLILFDFSPLLEPFFSPSSSPTVSLYSFFTLSHRKQLGSYARCIGKQGGSVSSAFPSTTFTAYPVKKDNN